MSEQFRAGESFLDFGTEIGDQRLPYGSLRGTAAGDAWYLYHYLNEIRQLRTIRELPVAPFPRREKYFLLYPLLRACELKQVTELGSAALEIIDGLEAVDRIFAPWHPANSVIPSTKFIGIEHSPLLLEVSRYLHSDCDTQLFSSVEAFDAHFSPKCRGILYDRIVASSAFRDVDAFARFLRHFDGGILNLLGSKEETFAAEFFGSRYTYFSLAELVNKLEKPLYHLFGLRAPKHASSRETGRPVIEGFFFYGDPELFDAFMGIAGEYPPISEFFAEKQLVPRPVEKMIAGA